MALRLGTFSSVIGELSPSLAANHAADSVEKKMSTVGRAFSALSRARVCPAPPWDRSFTGTSGYFLLKLDRKSWSARVGGPLQIATVSVPLGAGARCGWVAATPAVTISATTTRIPVSFRLRISQSFLDWLRSPADGPLCGEASCER